MQLGYSVGQIIRGITLIFQYMDDVLVASTYEQDNRKYLCLVFHCFQDYGISIKTSEWTTGAPAVEVFGHDLDGEGIQPQTEKKQCYLGLPKTAAFQ